MQNIIVKRSLFLLSLTLLACGNNNDIVYSDIEGLYSCDENSPNLGYRKYIIEIQEVAAQENAYIMANFHNLGDNEFVYLEHIGDSVFINNQIIQQYFIDGKGFVNEDFTGISLTYTTNDGTQELEYYIMLTR